MFFDFDKEGLKMSKGNTLQEMLGNFSPIPLKGENFDEYYVDTYEARGNNPIKKIKLNLEYSLNPYFKVLFLGHTGSGKSTELYLLEEAVKEKFEVISFSILEEVDGMDLYFTDFVFAIMAQIIKYLDEGISCSQEALDALYDYWNKEKIIETVEIEESNAETGVGSKIGFLKMISLEGKGILKSGAQTKITTREKMEPKIGYLVQLINRVLNDINIQLKEKRERNF